MKCRLSQGGLENAALECGGRHSRFLLPGKRVLLVVALMSTLASPVINAQSVLDQSEERVIRYESSVDLRDPVTLLQRRLTTGSASLAFETNHGYLPSLLQSLGVPVSSQTLVFSRTSSQRAHTSPATPRALYFSDTVSVGWAPGAAEIDVASVDPKLGPLFYTLSQTPGIAPKFSRRMDCMGCHLGPKTLEVPGLLVRSYFTATNGTPLATVNEFIGGHDAPIASRWGGWYVTGAATDPHLGNAFVPAASAANQLDVAREARLSNLKSLTNCFDTRPYLSAESDIVALLVLEHQTRMQNLITHACYETRLALAERAEAPGSASTAAKTCQERIARAGDLLLEYMLFRNEAPLKGQVRGSSSYTREFQAAGIRDHHGRSFRELDLNTRLFRYPCSYLVYSASFEALPPEMKDYLWTRLGKILTGRDHTPAFASMNANDRSSVLEILRDTKPDFAAQLKTDYSGL